MQKEKIKDWQILEFFVPIEEKVFNENSDEFLIRGVAINETTTLNNVKYVANELANAAPTFRNVPILLDHKNEVKNIVGRTTENVNFNPINKRIDFEGRIMDKDIREMIKDGRIQSVSIGAKVDDLTEESDGSKKAIGIRGLEISLVAVPGDSQANLAQAIQHCFHLREMANESNEERAEQVVDKLNTKENIMAEEEKKELPVEEPVAEEAAAEKAPLEKSVTETVDPVIASQKKELEELKEILAQKKKIQEELKAMDTKVDETKGEVSVDNEVVEKTDNFIVEKSVKGKGFDMYEDFTRNENLKRLIR